MTRANAVSRANLRASDETGGGGFNPWALIELRKSRDLNSKQLAVASGVSLPYLSQLEHGTKRNPKRDVIESLANALHVDPRALDMNYASEPSGSRPRPRTRQ